VRLFDPISDMQEYMPMRTANGFGSMWVALRHRGNPGRVLAQNYDNSKLFGSVVNNL
jgi:hypothetical protein